MIIAALPLTLALINEYEPLVTISGPDKLFLTKVVKCKIFLKLVVLGIFYRFLFVVLPTYALMNDG